MKKITYKRMSREDLANPFKESYHDRLVKSGAIDLTDNCIFIDLGNGYCRTEIIDETKLVK